MSPAQVKRDPFEAEFFVGEEDTEETYGRTDSLVREVIQNALDARRGDARVHVRLSVHDPADAPHASAIEPYFSGLLPHLSASKLRLLADGLAREPMSWLVYEDFGTRGLCGDPARTDDPPAAATEPEDFY
jgi:hypothetical protein